MADYIYLLQNRLTPAQWRALEAVREAARSQAMPLFLVGGAVRDLTTGSPVRDLDFAVQGDASALVPDLEAGGAIVTGNHPILESVYLTFRGGARAELSPSLSISYPKPGQPEAQPAPILDDLRRRDFTANAMAVSLNEGSYGLLLDPLNGTADIENRELRLVSNYGFIEQPALLLRAARFNERLGWNLEERTATRYQTAKEENYIQALSATDRGYELEEIFHEEDPLSVLEHMKSEGWDEVLFPALEAGDADRASMDAVRELIGQMEGQGIHPDPSAVYFPLLTAKLSEKDKAAVKAMFLRQGFVEQVEKIEARSKELAAQLTSKGASLPSESWRLLKEAEPDLVLWLAYHTRSGAVQSKIKAFLKDWPQMRQKIPYALMQEMRITPDLPVYEKLLDDLFFALIDGKLDTPEATRAFLEPYSPPAPPQVAVRRRPAKSARSRSKRALAAEPIEEIDHSEAAEDEQEDEDTPRRTTGSDTEDEDDIDIDDKDVEDESGEDDDEDEPKSLPRRTQPPAEDVLPTSAAKKSPAKSVKVVASAAEKNLPAKVPTPSKIADEKVPPTALTPAKDANKVAGSKDADKPSVAGRPSPGIIPKKASPQKAAPEVPAKAPTKSSPAKSAHAAPKKAAAEVEPAKASTKTVPAKAAPNKASSKAPSAKEAAKKVIVVSHGSAPAKHSAPAKAAKKVAAKGRSGR